MPVIGLPSGNHQVQTTQAGGIQLFLHGPQFIKSGKVLPVFLSVNTLLDTVNGNSGFSGLFANIKYDSTLFTYLGSLLGQGQIGPDCISGLTPSGWTWGVGSGSTTLTVDSATAGLLKVTLTPGVALPVLQGGILLGLTFMAIGASGNTSIIGLAKDQGGGVNPTYITDASPTNYTINPLLKNAWPTPTPWSDNIVQII